MEKLQEATDTILNDHNLSYEEVGLLLKLISLQCDNKKISINDLANSSKTGEYAVRTILKSLEEKGYLQIIRNTGKSSEYLITI